MEKKAAWKQIPEMGSPAGEVSTISELLQTWSSEMLKNFSLFGLRAVEGELTGTLSTQE